MCVSASKFSVRAVLYSLCIFFCVGVVPARGQAPMTTRDAGNEALYVQSDIDVYVNGPNGAALDTNAVVTLLKLSGQFYDQKTAKNGYVRFNGVPASEYIVQVVAPKYQGTSKNLEIKEESLAKITIELSPLSDAEDAASSVALYALPGRAQREVGKALEDLRSNKSADALKHLQAAQKGAPQSAEIEYLFGVYASQTNDHSQAKAYWLKTLQMDPKHLSALLGVGFDYLHENKPAEAEPYLIRAVAAEPASWRAHALLGEALVLQDKNDEAEKEAQRAIELGHDRASSAQLVLARALAARGKRDEAIKNLEAYVKANPKDAAASKDLETLKNPPPAGTAATSDLDALSKDASALPVPSNWLPPGVDDSVPPVISGATCNVDDVVKKAGLQLNELIKDVDRFAATESIVHQSIDRYGMPSGPEKRKFDYVASIQELRGGFLNVEEYRSNNGLPADFPGGVATNGLPALVLIFHPNNANDFAMTCEGLARWDGGLAWQVHFRQRPDKPNVIKRYRIGVDGPSYAVSLKGRAWIASDTYQIVRLETDLVAPVPQIKLVADRADVEYGPVKFAKGNVSMWLPKSADVYYDWKGRRIHRRHSFSNYMLFAVDDKQKISAPKTDASVDNGPSDSPKQNP